MNVADSDECGEICPACRAIIGSDRWSKIIGDDTTPDPEGLKKKLQRMGDQGFPKFLPDLALLELTVRKVSDQDLESLHVPDKICINPTLHLLNLSWKNLHSILNMKKDAHLKEPDQGEDLVVIWKEPEKGKVNIRSASKDEILALKIISEDIESEQVAKEGNVPIGVIDNLIKRAVHTGMLIAPSSKIKRDPSIFQDQDRIDKSYLSSHSFTLQWHITQACDLHCRHCYDRSVRTQMKLEKALEILDDLRKFCRNRHVIGAISFTGGNPFLYPHFLDLYRSASARGFSLGILGNPTSCDILENIISIQRPTHIQVSLEGLPEHNDYIRGEGHFIRVIEFLKLLRDLKIFSMVMLTLTKENVRQVIPLAKMLRDLVDRFHFNRLSMVGEGINLSLPEKEEYIAFLEEYIQAAEKNPILGLKDNLINILRYNRGLQPFGGCAGYGCGAAFNFLTLLPDGEMHACRKFPSPVGNIFNQGIEEIYDSEIANRYRSGCLSCKGCPIRSVCGGCLAVSYSHGLNIFEDKDPFCFFNPVYSTS